MTGERCASISCGFMELLIFPIDADPAGMVPDVLDYWSGNCFPLIQTPLGMVPDVPNLWIINLPGGFAHRVSSCFFFWGGGLCGCSAMFGSWFVVPGERPYLVDWCNGFEIISAENRTGHGSWRSWCLVLWICPVFC